MPYPHSDNNRATAFSLCGNKYVWADYPPKRRSCFRFFRKLFKDRLGENRRVQVVEDPPGKGNQARAKGITFAISIFSNKAGSLQRLKDGKSLAFMDSHAGADFGEARER